jgi:DNA-binding Xre family transcriptional regulator
MQGITQMSYFKTNLKQLMLKKSVELGQPLNRSDIAEATGLSLPTISRWYKGEVKTVESDTIGALMKFFNCDFIDLVEYVPDSEIIGDASQ